MTLAESGDSSASVSLGALFAGKLGRCHETVGLSRIIWLMMRGGWPGALELDEKSALEIPSHYVEEAANSDMSRVDNRKRDARKVKRLLYSLARNNMTMVANGTLMKDVLEKGSVKGFSEPTMISYLGALKKIFMIEDLPGWAPKLRSRSRIRTTPKKHFVDPSLAIASLGATAEALRGDLNTFGLMFENLVVRDLKVYAEFLGGKVYHYHDATGLEADAIIELPDGRWAALEVKLGAAQEEEAAKSLKNVEKKVVEAGGDPPAFKAVVCGVCDFSYQREDGVFVVPITALGV
jgi:predicted AAA+ superfamily ATPase